MSFPPRLGLAAVAALSLLIGHEALADSDRSYGPAWQGHWSDWSGAQELKSGRTAASAQSVLLWPDPGGRGGYEVTARGFNAISFTEYSVTGNKPVAVAAEAISMPLAFQSNPKVTLVERWVDTKKDTGIDTKRVALPPGMLIQAVQVCQNDASPDERELKGLRIWGNPIDPSTGIIGQTLASTDTAGMLIGYAAEAKRSNCKNWEPPATCPAGQIVAAIRPYSTSKGMQSLGVLCRRVYNEKNTAARGGPFVISSNSGVVNGTYNAMTTSMTFKFDATLTNEVTFPSTSTGKISFNVSTILHPNDNTHASFPEATITGLAPGKNTQVTVTSTGTARWVEDLGCGATALSCDVQVRVSTSVSPWSPDGTAGGYVLIRGHLTRPSAK